MNPNLPKQEVGKPIRAATLNAYRDAIQRAMRWAAQRGVRGVSANAFFAKLTDSWSPGTGAMEYSWQEVVPAQESSGTITWTAVGRSGDVNTDRAAYGLEGGRRLDTDTIVLMVEVVAADGRPLYVFLDGVRPPKFWFVPPICRPLVVDDTGQIVGWYYESGPDQLWHSPWGYDDPGVGTNSSGWGEL